MMFCRVLPQSFGHVLITYPNQGFPYSDFRLELVPNSISSITNYGHELFVLAEPLLVATSVPSHFQVLSVLELFTFLSLAFKWARFAQKPFCPIYPNQKYYSKVQKNRLKPVVQNHKNQPIKVKDIQGVNIVDLETHSRFPDELDYQTRLKFGQFWLLVDLNSPGTEL